MTPDEMTERITRLLEQGIRDSIERREVMPFKQAAIEAYKLRMAGDGLDDEEGIANHVFPSDVEQTARLSLQIVETDKEKASILLKGALDQVLNRLSVVIPVTKEESSPRNRWKFWRRS